MQSILSSHHGFRAQDAYGDERWEAEGNALQYEARATDGATQRKTSCYIVSLENTSSTGPFVVHNVRTAEEVRQAVYENNKQVPNDVIRLDLYSARMGAMNRKKLEGVLPPDVQDIYVRLCLQKHPAIPACAKFEHMQVQ